MDTVDVKISELIGAALDWAVAKVEGYTVMHNATLKGQLMRGFWLVSKTDPNAWYPLVAYFPSRDWGQGGPLIQSRRVAVDFTRPVRDDEPVNWVAQVWQPYGCATGVTPLMAACRTIVAAHLGDTVNVPAELVNP